MKVISFDNFYPSAHVLAKIYNHSTIDQEDYYKNCTYISMHSSNSQKEVESMPFYVFNNYLIYLHEQIKIENKTNGNGENNEDEETDINSAQNSYKTQMSNASKMQNNASKTFANSISKSKSLLKK